LSEQHIILATDIFGHTPYIDDFLNTVLPDTTSREVIDPYQKQHRHHSEVYFRDEAQAYEAFIDQCGHAQYARKLALAVKQCNLPVYLIGFSAGASAAWKASHGINPQYLKQLIGFYPTQIRYELNLDIMTQTTLIFPHAEKHFDLLGLIGEVSQRQNVNCIHSEYEHGFMNPMSQSYSPQALQKFSQMVKRLWN